MSLEREPATLVMLPFAAAAAAVLSLVVVDSRRPGAFGGDR